MIKDAWAKLVRDTPDEWPRSYLPLASHCADVAAVLAALLEIPTLRRRFSSLAGVEIDEDLASVMTAAAFLHDIGKTNLGFWRKQCPASCLGKVSVAGHVREAAPLLADAYGGDRCSIPEAGEFLDPETPAGMFFLVALAHHGKPISRSTIDEWALRAAELWRAVDGYDPVQQARALCRQMNMWMPEAMAAAARIDEPSNAVLHAFSGALSLADWLGSNAGIEFFPFDHGGANEERWAFSLCRARQVVRATMIDPERSRRDLTQRNPGFGDVFRDEARDMPHAPTPLQRMMEDLSLGRIVVLEAETGSGKTEAALWRFRTLFAAGEVDGMAFLLPTRTAATQIEGRVRRAVERMWPARDARPQVVLALPGYMRADGEEGRILPDHRVLWPDAEDQDVVYRRWAAEGPKRRLASCIVVGTIDQALMSALKIGHAHMRGVCLLSKLLVIDEVHASDAYMTGLLRVLLERHEAAGGHALLLSATLGSDARARLLSPSRAARPPLLSPEEARACPYPAVSDRRGIRAAGTIGRSKVVSIRAEPLLDAPEMIARPALEAASRGARVLVVRNTVAGAVALQQAVEAACADERSRALLFRVNDIPAPHHGRFAAPDRRLLDQSVERSFGKGADGAGIVLIGTQTLEQSLDIDADLLIADLCPMDVLLQRIGRLHRHRRARPAGFERPTAVVLTPEARDLSAFLPTRKRGGLPRHGLGGHVYPNVAIIEATWRKIEQNSIWSIPDNCRQLVEDATHPEALRALVSSLGPDWEAHRMTISGVASAHAQQSGIVSLDWDEDPIEKEFPKAVDERLVTRLGIHDRRFIVESQIKTPFGCNLEEIVIPGWMVDGVPEHIESIIVDSYSDSEISFSVCGKRFVYNSWGLWTC